MGDNVSVHVWVDVGVGGGVVSVARGTRQDLVAGRAWMGRKGVGSEVVFVVVVYFLLSACSCTYS